MWLRLFRYAATIKQCLVLVDKWYFLSTSGILEWNFLDNEGFGGLLCPELGKGYFNGWIDEKSSLGNGFQVFQLP